MAAQVQRDLVCLAERVAMDGCVVAFVDADYWVRGGQGLRHKTLMRIGGSISGMKPRNSSNSVTF